MGFKFLALSIFLIFTASATAQVGTPVPAGQTVTVDAHGECRQVTNPGSGTRMVFTGTASEWQSFRDNPSGLTMDACVACTPDEWVARENNRSWSAIAVSDDGKRMIAAAHSAQLFTSTDGGATWTARESARSWTGVASSADGTKLAATVLNGQIYVSSNSGATWTARESNRMWRGIISSADGTRLVAITTKAYISTDGGASWVAGGGPPSGSGGTGEWTVMAATPDAMTLFATNADSDTSLYRGRLFLSTNGGTSWTTINSSLRNWVGLAISADGSKLVASDGSNGRLYISTNGGSSWTAHESNRYWTGVAMSQDGSKILAASRLNGRLHRSTDGGVTWSEEATNGYWWRVAMSKNGHTAAAILTGEKIYTSGCGGESAPPPPADCTTPWGAAVAHGSSITAYQAASVPHGSSCVSQSRTCNDGTLTGSYTHQACEVELPAAEGTWVTVCRNNYMPCGEGPVLGACQAVIPISCSPLGAKAQCHVKQGQVVIFYDGLECR